MKTGKLDTGDKYTQDHWSAFGLARGPDGTRSLAPEHGMLRYNSTRKTLEGYINNAWGELVTDHIMSGGKDDSGMSSGNATRAAIKDIMSQLFSTSEGAVFVQYGQGFYTNNINNDTLTDISTLEPLPRVDTDPDNGYIEVLDLAASNITPLGLRNDRGSNYIYCRSDIQPGGSVTGGFKIDFPKYFKLAEGPTAVVVSRNGRGSGARVLVGAMNGRINRYWIDAPGQRFAVGDNVIVSPGKKYENGAYTFAGRGAVLTVSGVDGNGGITSIDIIETGADYPPNSRYNYIYDTISGLGGMLDGTDGCGSHNVIDTGPASGFHMHMVPAWSVSPTNIPRSDVDKAANLDENLKNNTDPNYGKFQITMDAKFLKQGNVSGRYLVTAFKFKEYSNLE